MPSRRLTHRRVVHKSTAGMLHSIPEAVGLVGNPPPDLTQNTVAGLGGRSYDILQIDQNFACAAIAESPHFHLSHPGGNRFRAN